MRGSPRHSRTCAVCCAGVCFPDCPAAPASALAPAGPVAGKQLILRSGDTWLMREQPLLPPPPVATVRMLAREVLLKDCADAYIFACQRCVRALRGDPLAVCTLPPAGSRQRKCGRCSAGGHPCLADPLVGPGGETPVTCCHQSQNWQYPYQFDDLRAPCHQRSDRRDDKGCSYQGS